ncbi:MAG: hypothetical protein WBP87_13195, partial [Candidatus Sulfotelmatobacter sp.]
TPAGRASSEDYRDVIVSQLFSRICLPQIVAVALLSATVTAATRTVCLLPTSTAPFPNAGCHHGRTPANPQPVDYRCCLSRHPSAITTTAFSPQPTLGVREACPVDIVAASGGSVPVVSFAPSSSPPVSLILRI